MMGMEKMLAQMIGITPEEMQATVKGLMEAANEGVKAVAELRAQNALILDKLQRLEKWTMETELLPAETEAASNLKPLPLIAETAQP